MDNWLHISIFALTQILMLVGLFGLVVPIYPGTVIMWLSALGYGLITGFSTLGVVLLVVMTALTLLSVVLDNLLMGAGARQGGASWLTIGTALVAGIVGTILFPPIGGIIAAPLAILLLEYARLRDWEKAWQALRGLATGFGLAYVLRLVIGILIMGMWWLWVWKG